MITETKNKKAFFNTEIPGDWDVKHFEEVADIDRDSLNGSTPKDYEFDYISLSDVDSDDFKIETTRQVFASAPSRARRIVKQGDILMSTVRPNLQGFSLIRNEVKDLIASTGFAVITTNKCSNEFLFQFLFSSGIERQFYQLLVGSNYPAINSSDVRKLKIPLPPIPEQKAIAQVLSKADAAIHTTEKLITQKELRKKWLMQQLLTGKKRLKGFDREWKFVRFKEIYSQVKQKAGDEKFLVLSVTKDGIVSQAEYFNKEIASEDTSPYLVVRKGDMAMSGLNFWMGSIDVLVEYEIGMISPAYKVFEIHNPEISAAFMKSFVRSEIMLQCLIGSSVVGASIVRRNLDRETLDEWSFRMPSLEEQNAIAQLLHAADKEIILLKAKAEKLREQKKGLMQVLLTGKVRLKINERK
jgi:type I restriction enzyme S subunit